MRGKLRLLLFLSVLLGMVLGVAVCFAAPPPPPAEPVPLFGEEILIPTLIGYGVYRLRKKIK